MKAYEDHIIAERDGITLNSSFGASRLQLVAAKRALMASNPIPGWKSQEEEQQEAADVAALARYAMGLREADYDGDASCATAPRYIQGRNQSEIDDWIYVGHHLHKRFPDHMIDPPL